MIVFMTRTGRRYFTKDLPDRGDGTYTNGYVEVDAAMVGADPAQFAREIIQAQGVSFFGKALLNQVAADGGPTVADYRTVTTGQRFMWLIGFDDHQQTIGRIAVATMTRELAERLDQLAQEGPR